MEKYAAALAAFGGLTAIGGLIDLLLYRDRKRLNWRLHYLRQEQEAGALHRG